MTVGVCVCYLHPSLSTQVGMTALMLATKCSHYNIVKALLERKANPNVNVTDKLKVSLCCMCRSCYTSHCVYRPEGGLRYIWPLKKAMLS